MDIYSIRSNNKFSMIIMEAAFNPIVHSCVWNQLFRNEDTRCRFSLVVVSLRPILARLVGTNF